MRHAGFVLTGGRSSRMGRDKALLPYGAGTLAGHIANQVLQAAGTVSLIGNPELCGGLGIEVHSDLAPGCGPLGGIQTALRLRQAGWNLIVACDLPNIRAPELQRILATADRVRDTVECVVPVLDGDRLQPLCAAYHSRCLPKVEDALREGRWKLMDLLAQLTTVELAGWAVETFRNVNAPADWETAVR